MNELIFRSSQVGYIMPSENARVDFTDTQRDKIVEAFNSHYYKRTEEIDSKYLEKGNERERDSTTLLSLKLRTMFEENEERKQNEYISGKWDLHLKKEKVFIKTLDTKSSWSKNTFDKARLKPRNKIYYYQGQCYMWLTGAKSHVIAYCLVNGTFKYITDQIRAIGWKSGILDGDVSKDPAYIEKIQQLERNHIFDINAFMHENPSFEPLNEVKYDSKNDKYIWNYDIPAERRVYLDEFEYNSFDVEKIKAQIIKSRKLAQILI